jgi:hypothetical protein
MSRSELTACLVSFIEALDGSAKITEAQLLQPTGYPMRRKYIIDVHNVYRREKH